MTAQPQYLPNAAIDFDRWNACIQSAINNQVYGYSWWLDEMSPGWDGLVLNDYEAVMPLTWKRKWGFSYLRQPWFTANLGLFYKRETANNLPLFLNFIPSKFRFWDIDVNEDNTVSKTAMRQLDVTHRKNMVLTTTGGYEAIYSRYARLAKRKLNLAIAGNLTVDADVDIETAVRFYATNYQQQHPGIHQSDYDRIAAACVTALDKGLARCYAAKRAGEVLAVYVVLKDDRYYYSLLGGSNAAGKKTGAFYLLTDAAIRDAAHDGCSFRFEGSDLGGVSFFNSQFGPDEINYYHVKLNRLPAMIKLWKQ